MRKVKDWYELYPDGVHSFRDGDVVKVLWLKGVAEDRLKLLSAINFKLEWSPQGNYYHQVPLTDGDAQLLGDLDLRRHGIAVLESSRLCVVMERRVYKLKDIIGVYYKNKRRSA